MQRGKETMDKLQVELCRLTELIKESRTKANYFAAGSHIFPSLRSRMESVSTRVTDIEKAVKTFVATHPDLKKVILGTNSEKEAEPELPSQAHFFEEPPSENVNMRVTFSEEDVESFVAKYPELKELILGTNSEQEAEPEGNLAVQSCILKDLRAVRTILPEISEDVVALRKKRTALEWKEMDFHNQVSGLLEQMDGIIKESINEKATIGTGNLEVGNIITKNKNSSMQAKGAQAENWKIEERPIKRKKIENTKPEETKSEHAQIKHTQIENMQTENTQTGALETEKQEKEQELDSLEKEITKTINLVNDNLQTVEGSYISIHFRKNRDSIRRCYRSIRSLTETMSASSPRSVAAVKLLADKVNALECHHKEFEDRYSKLHSDLMTSFINLLKFSKELWMKSDLLSNATTLEDVRSISLDMPDWWSSIADIGTTNADWIEMELTSKLDDCREQLDFLSWFLIQRQ